MNERNAARQLAVVFECLRADVGGRLWVNRGVEGGAGCSRV